jgi:nucleotide-binding universal stress UspA family protein
MFKNILAAIDGSQPSHHALTVAADLAQQQHATLTIVTVVPPTPPLLMEDNTQTYLPEYQEQLHKSHQKLLNKTVADLKTIHPGLKTATILKEGSPARKIIEAANEQDADLIVLGNRGTGGALTWLLGSVSRQVTESCTAPVLIVKHQRYCQAT